jgi:adenine phosphoribosyltransferase
MSTAIPTADDIRAAIRNVPDFPKPGIQFKDITPVLADPRLFAAAVDLLTAPWAAGAVDAVAGIDARGFIFGAAAALKLTASFIPVRKQGKLPAATIEESYDLEYGSNTIAIHADACQPGDRVLIVDDLLATGGTAAAAARLIKRLGGEVVEVACLIELAFLKGRERLTEAPFRAVITY